MLQRMCANRTKESKKKKEIIFLSVPRDRDSSNGRNNNLIFLPSFRMTAKLPYMPEGSRAMEMAKLWTPHMQERIRLLSRGTRLSPKYDQGASINGGKSWARLQSQRNYDQRGVSSDTFNNFIKALIKVNKL